MYSIQVTLHLCPASTSGPHIKKDPWRNYKADLNKFGLKTRESRPKKLKNQDLNPFQCILHKSLNPDDIKHQHRKRVFQKKLLQKLLVSLSA